jgi:hypothetical protein
MIFYKSHPSDNLAEKASERYSASNLLRALTCFVGRSADYSLYLGRQPMNSRKTFYELYKSNSPIGEAGES